MLKKLMITEHGKVNQFFGGVEINHLLFLMLLGSLTAISSYLIDVTIFEINSSKFESL